MDPQVATWQNDLESASLSDLGLRRGNNQDSMAVVLATSHENWLRRGHLFIVADGMGAHAAGELASKLATDIVPQTYQKLRDRTPPDALQAAIRDANVRIYSRGQGNEEFKGMGTTITTLAMLPEGAMLAQVGDSRAYRLRGGRLEQLTFDHSLVWEMRAAGQLASDDVPNYIPRNIITRSLGPNPEVEVDLEGPFPLQVGDTFLLCSDGLSGQVHDDEIGKVLACLPPKEAVRALVDLANLRGGPDNITVIVVRANGVPAVESAPPSASRPVVPEEHRPVPLVLWGLFGVLLLAAGGAAVLGWTVPAVASGVAAAVAGLMALLQQLTDRRPAPFLDGPLGKGPYTVCDAVPDASFVERLAKLNQQLREAAACEDWVIDWERFNNQSYQAQVAGNASNFPEAVRQYCHAICYMMEQLRQQRDRLRDASDTDFDLA